MTEYVIVYAYTVNSGNSFIPAILKNKPAYLKGLLNLPGGKLNVGETPVEAAIRELKEETGLDELSVIDGMCPFSSELMGVIKFDDCVIHCVSVPTIYQDLNQQAGETEPVDWYDVEELLQDSKLIPNLRLVVPLMLCGVKGWEIEDHGDGSFTVK